MDRVSIKSQAREMISGKLGVIWKPLGIIVLVNIAVSILLLTMFGVDNKSIQYNFVSALISIALAPISVGLLLYMLKFVRNQNPDNSDVWSLFSKFVPIILTTLLAGLVIGIGFILLIIPGIVMSFGFAMHTYILADPNYNKLGPVQILEESWRLMKGYKLDFFVFNMSFLGWFILAPFTLGILFVWLIPYMLTAQTLYYEKLKANKKID